MKAAIMQPYFFPHIDYFQLIGVADRFVVYDNIKYTKKGWINRNRYLSNGTDAIFSIPLRKDSDYLDVRDRRISPEFNRNKLLNQLKDSYRKAPFFDSAYPLVEEIVMHDETNLFSFIHNSIVKTCSYLEIDTPMTISSAIQIDHGLTAQDKVMALCKAIDADRYINPIGGQALYSKSEFAGRGIELAFLRSKPFVYEQAIDPFVPGLSVVDVVMFNPRPRIQEHLKRGYDLI